MFSLQSGPSSYDGFNDKWVQKWENFKNFILFFQMFFLF
jgi:hypothetical protein